MAETKNTSDALHELAREDAKLRGEVLATGVILTQLLQSICKQQLNPHAFATKIMTNAQNAVLAFKPDGDKQHDVIMKDYALETVKRYEEQIRSVLPI